MSVSAKLKRASKLWKKAKERAEEQGPGFAEYPDGRYIMKVTGAEVGESQNGRVQIAWKLAFADGEYDGKDYHDYQGLETEDNLVYVAARLDRFGYEPPDDLTDLAETLKEIVEEGPEIRVRLKSKGDFQNCYVDGLVDADGGEEEEEGEEEEAEAKPARKSRSKKKSDPEEEEEEEAAEVVKGSTVTLESEDNESEYTVTAIKKDDVTITDDDDNEYEVELDDCVVVETEEEEEEEEGEEADEGEEVQVGVGSRVVAENKKGEEVEGVIKRIARNGEKVSIEDDEGVMHRGIPVENVKAEAVDDEPAKEPAKKRGAKKKTGSRRKKR